MHRLTILVALAFALSVGASEAAKPASKPTGAGKPTTVKTKTSKPTGAPVKSGSKGSSVKSKGGAANGSSTKSVKVKAAKADTKSTGAATKAAKADSKMAKADQKTTKKAGTTASLTTKTNTIDFEATSLGQTLQKNSVQRSKIEAKLLEAGYTGTIYEAAYGFKNLGQLNAATNQVQNQGISFELLKVMMTGTYVDPDTHLLYRANRSADGTVKLLDPTLARNPVSPLSLGQSKQAIAGGATLPVIVPYEPAISGNTSRTSGSF
jgi:hypothetical protein